MLKFSHWKYSGPTMHEFMYYYEAGYFHRAFRVRKMPPQQHTAWHKHTHNVRKDLRYVPFLSSIILSKPEQYGLFGVRFKSLDATAVANRKFQAS